jgi:23S rRNA (cytosine1962-C5)-methyltransferase
LRSDVHWTGSAHPGISRGRLHKCAAWSPFEKKVPEARNRDCARECHLEYMAHKQRHSDAETAIAAQSDAAAAGAPTAVSGALQLVETAGFPDYALLDSGSGRKLERFGAIVVDRPEPQALWTPRLTAEWRGANAVFAGAEDEEKGRWRIDTPVPESWPVRVGAATVLCRLSGFRHMGLFPEQLPHWEWMLARLREITGEPPRVLNLFGYTGAASLLAAAAGAHVTHVDASKKAIAWGKENQAASKLGDAPIRWILDDAQKFVAREVRRAKTYHVILVDPPKFGRGPDGEVWELFEHLPGLLKDCARLLAPGRAALVLTVYAIRASALAFDQLARETLKARGGAFSSGELAIREAGSDPRLLPASLFTRWVSDERA